jgi:hypothetical protein
MISFLVLNYNRPKETELCLKSIKKFTTFSHEVVLLNNGGQDHDAIFQFFKDSLIDKLTLRSKNSGCGLGTRELFNDFNLSNEYVIYVQCDQFMIREFSEQEIISYINTLKSDESISHIDLSGNQGNGNYSERAHLINKKFYNSVPNTIGGPGPYANEMWTEESLQKFLKANNKRFLISKNLLFADNGKISIREYPCGGELIQYTDTKEVFITKPIKARVDFPNIHLTDKEWKMILSNTWVDGTIPHKHRENSFLFWKKPFYSDIMNG